GEAKASSFFRSASEPERDGHRGPVGLPGEVVGKSGSLRRIFPLLPETPFEGEVDVAAQPAPVQPVEVRIQGVLRRPLRRIGIIEVRWETQGKTNRLPFARGSLG